MITGPGFEGLAEGIRQKMARKIARLRTMKSLRRNIQRAWVELVQKSASTRPGAPVTSLIAREGEVGWRVWGKFDRSLARYQPRINAFREVVLRAVRESTLRALREEGDE